MKADPSPDRHLLLPSIEEVVALRDQSQPFAWKISEELLRRQFLKSDEAAGEQGSDAPVGSDSSRLVAVLEKSVAMLERELAEKNSQIAAYNDRLRESNILMKDLQQRFALPAPKSADAEKVDTPTESKKSSPSPNAKKKRRPFGWIFGA